MHAATGTKKNATKQEDETLIRMVEIHGERRWNKVAEGVAGRNGKGCSHRCVCCQEGIRNGIKWVRCTG